VYQAQPILERLKALHPKIIDLSLARMHRLLAALDNPHHRLPPVLHIAGTNGKGSLTAFVRAMALAAGLRPHVYTSPHLVRFNERIELAGRQVEDDRLADLLARCEHANDGQPITFFEITTAAGLLGFAETPADVLILEVGLGGRLDATNVLDRPDLTAITPIGLDHQQFLGDTVQQIAGEKAGILKDGVPAIIGPQQPEAAAVIAARAADLAVPLVRSGTDFTGRASRAGLMFQDAEGETLFPHPGLYGAHQYDNATTAIACARSLRRLGFSALTDGAIAAGLRQVVWPARLQRLTRGPMLAALPSGMELWLDGGHNPHAGAALARTLASWSDRPLRLVMGMLDTKAPEGFLAPLVPHVQDLRCVTIPGEAHALPAEHLTATAHSLGLPAQASSSVAAAVADLARPADGARVLVCGSLYLAGSVLADHG